MIKDLKQNYKVFLFTFIYGLLTYSLYFNAHYVHDSYRIYNLGFLQNLSGFWSQGRPISMCFNILFNFLKISPRIGQIISIFLTILFLALSAAIVYSLILKRTDKKSTIDLKTKVLLGLISCFLFFNVYITDWMMFLESCVIALGALFSTIGAYYIIEQNDKLKKYIFSSMFFIIGIFCYQASIAMAGAIVVLFTIYDNKDKKLLLIIKELILNMIPYILALLTNFIFIKVVNLGNSYDTRLSGNIDIFHNILFVIKQAKSYFVHMLNYPTRDIVALLILGLFIFYIIKLIINKDKKITLLYIIVSLFALWFLSVLPIIVMPSASQYFISRSIPYIASIFPFMLLVFYLFNNDIFKGSIKIYSVILLIYGMLTTASVIKVTSECLKNNTQDIQIAKTIQDKIETYEQNTNNIIDTIILLPDKYASLSEENITYYSDNTVRAFVVHYAAREIMYFVSQKYYNVAMGTNEQKVELFGDKEWNTFNLEQLKFDKNILYMVRY